MPYGTVTKQRQLYSTERLAELSAALESSETLKRFEELCVYVTGSYARGEAHKGSDLDLFFLHKGSFEKNALTRVDETLFFSELIQTCRELNYPEFSSGGKYLKVQYVDDGMSHLGSPADDYANYFTARALLLLESKRIFNERSFQELLQRTLQAYYRDYDPDQNDFRPVFLLNDLIRYWKTLCLNYEHQRNSPPTNHDDIAETRIKNLKLKFSRLLTCFSMIFAVSQTGTGISATEVAKISRMTPLERMHDISEISMIIDDEFSVLVKLYDWFLERTGQPIDSLKQWIMDDENLALCKRNGKEFGYAFYEITGKVILDDELRRYLII